MDVFYRRLFAAAPSVEPLFAGTDLPAKRRCCSSTLVLLRKSLRNIDAIVPNCVRSAHATSPMAPRPEHYPVVGEVLIASLAEIAGNAWRPEHELAWAAAFAVIADAMVSGAREAQRDIAA